MQSTPILTVLVLIFLVNSGAECKCDSFKDVEASVQPDTGQPYKTQITGCIQRVTFDKTITQVEIKHQKIPKLGVDSVRNMKHLINVKFYRCEISTIEPGSFRNVPSLRSIQIVSNEIPHVPAGIFSLVPQLEILKFNNNKIETMDDGVFSNAPTFKKIYLDHNQLSVWRKEWFTNTTNIQLMDFRYNKIQELPRGAFSSLPKLKEIYLDYNDLKSIPPEAFEGISQLDQLGLRYNRLKEISPATFPHQISIDVMMIDANFLNYIAADVRRNLRIKTVTFDGNPWKCSCLDEILLWLRESKASVKSAGLCTRSNIPVCSFPSNNSKTCIEKVDDEVTNNFLQELRRINPPSPYCARLD